MQITQKITLWDGKSAAYLQELFDTHHSEPDFADQLIALSQTKAAEIAATWLLLAWLQAGQPFTPPQMAKICGALGQLQHWQARLHMLQSMPFMVITEAERDNVAHFLRMSLSDQNKFVRAWAYHGFYELSRQHPIYTSETQQYFALAIRDEAASVKARIRNILKKGF
jgi:hypothetical protein